METFVDVVVHQESVVNILCNLDQIGDWIGVLQQKDFNIVSVSKAETAYNSTDPNKKDVWNVVGARSWSMDERWEGIEVG
jgi:hypothetical protein